MTAPDLMQAKPGTRVRRLLQLAEREAASLDAENRVMRARLEIRDRRRGIESELAEIKREALADHARAAHLETLFAEMHRRGVSLVCRGFDDMRGNTEWRAIDPDGRMVGVGKSPILALQVSSQNDWWEIPF